MYSFKQLSPLLVALLIATNVSLAYQKQVRNLDTFTKVSLRTSVDVYLTQGDSQKIEVTGDSEDIDKLETKVRDGKLIIDDSRENSWKSWSGLKGVEIHITVKNIEALAVAGSGDIKSKSKFECADLAISVAGSGDLEFDANAKNVNIRIAGSGSVYLKGSSKINNVSIAGSGKLDAQQMETDTYKISIAGSGKCKVHAKEEIKSRISGSGSVYYKGEPKRIDNSASGSSKVKKI